MTSRREAVLEAVKALIVAAMPLADVQRNRDKSDDIAPGGRAILRDGDPGEAEVTMSPLQYTYTHAIPLEIGVPVDDPETRSARLDALLVPLGAAIAADRTLGGLCDWLDVSAPATDDAEAFGFDPLRWADFSVIATYTSSSPLS